MKIKTGSFSRKRCSHSTLFPYLHTTSIELGLGHSYVEASLLISSGSCCHSSTGLLVGAVNGQLIKCDLREKKEVGRVCGSNQGEVKQGKTVKGMSEGLAFMPPASYSALAMRMSKPAR